MKNKVAQFKKVSEEQFVKDWNETFGHNKYTYGMIKHIYNTIKLPKRATSRSAGYDFFAPIHIILEHGKTMKIPTGIRCKMDSNWFLSIVPRSGIGFKQGVSLANTIGIIDSDYYYSDNEGHIFIKMVNESCIGKTVDISEGQGMAQGIFLPFGITVNDESDGIRNGGFGSTDYKIINSD